MIWNQKDIIIHTGSHLNNEFHTRMHARKFISFEQLKEITTRTANTYLTLRNTHKAINTFTHQFDSEYFCIHI